MSSKKEKENKLQKCKSKKKIGRRLKQLGDWKDKFLDSLKTEPNVGKACEAAGITYSRVYGRYRKEAAFRNEWDIAVKMGVHKMESVAFQRATEGVSRPIWMKDADGVPIKVDTVKEPSDTLMIFLLKAHAPEKYRETSNVRLSNSDGKPLPAQIIAPVVQFVLPQKTTVDDLVSANPINASPVPQVALPMKEQSNGQEAHVNGS